MLFPGGVEGWPHNVHALTSGAEEPVGRFPPVPVAKEAWWCRPVCGRVFLLVLCLHAIHDSVFGVKCSDTVSRQPNQHQNWSIKGTHSIDQNRLTVSELQKCCLGQSSDWWELCDCSNQICWYFLSLCSFHLFCYLMIHLSHLSLY